MKNRFAIVVGLTAILLTGVVSQLSAQGEAAYPAVETTVDPTSGTVGDKFLLTITATAPDAGGLGALPLIEIDEQSTWTLLGRSTQPGTSSGGLESREYHYTIAPFETGQIALPQVAITYTPADGSTSNTVLSEPLVVSIDSVVAGSSAGTNLRDVKRPVTLPLPAAVVWSGFVLLLVVLALAGWLIWRRYSARLKSMFGGVLSPDERALKALDQLEHERLVEQKKLKEYYTRLADTVREYLAEAYGLHAVDLTSNELLRALDDLAGDQPALHSQEYRIAMARLTDLLDEADLVKFARLMPDAAHCRRALQHGREVVSLTSYRFHPDEEQENSSKGNTNHSGSMPPPPPLPDRQLQGAHEGGHR